MPDLRHRREGPNDAIKQDKGTVILRKLLGILALSCGLAGGLQVQAATVESETTVDVGSLTLLAETPNDFIMTMIPPFIFDTSAHAVSGAIDEVDAAFDGTASASSGGA